MRIALRRSCAWLRSSWQIATMPVGRCVMRTAVSVLFTCCPPAPPARIVSMRRSSGAHVDLDLGLLGQHRDRRGARVDAALRLGRGHALHAVAAGFEAQLAPRALALDREHDFLEAADLARRDARGPRPSSASPRSTCGRCRTDRARRASPRRRRRRRGSRRSPCGGRRPDRARALRAPGVSSALGLGLEPRRAPRARARRARRRGRASARMRSASRAARRRVAGRGRAARARARAGRVPAAATQSLRPSAATSGWLISSVISSKRAARSAGAPHGPGAVEGHGRSSVTVARDAGKRRPPKRVTPMSRPSTSRLER